MENGPLFPSWDKRAPFDSLASGAGESESRHHCPGATTTIDTAELLALHAEIKRLRREVGVFAGKLSRALSERKDEAATL